MSRTHPPTYITALGAVFPNDPVNNDDIESRLGGGRSRAKRRVLAQNGILTRHYALDQQGRPTHRVAELAALAIRQCLRRGGSTSAEVDFLAAATTQGDLLVPGFASMVQGELGVGPFEIASLHGVCASGLMALQNAHLQVAMGKQTALACAAEQPSRALKASWFGRGRQLDFDSEFLRWMLSDGAGAALLEPEPSGASLRVDWIELWSYAHQFSTCMYAGARKQKDGSMSAGWLAHEHPQEAAYAGLFELRQDVRMLDDIVKLGVQGFFELVERGRLDPAQIDWMVCHYSSQFFRSRIFELLSRGGMRIPEERWFSNLSRRGNVGSASAFVLLEELFQSGRLRSGDRVCLVIPESGRALMGYALFTYVDSKSARSGASRSTDSPPLPSVASAPPPMLKLPADPVLESLVRRLTLVWMDFERSLADVPILKRLYAGDWTREDYRRLLLQLRPQVVEGSRWIARAASNLTGLGTPLRTLFIAHAHDEHRDYELLERDYVAVGGDLEEIQRARKNVGSEALSAWMFHRASQENPFDLLGAMFVIEGLGSVMASRWAKLIQQQLNLSGEQVSFLRYHGDNDADHFERLEKALSSGVINEEVADAIVRTARVTARLYRLQLEEMGSE